MNFVSLMGRIKGKVDDKTVLLELNRPEGSENVESLRIPCQYWTQSSRCLLTSIANNTLVVIRGRLDQDTKLGTFVIVEEVTIIK